MSAVILGLVIVSIAVEPAVCVHTFVPESVQFVPVPVLLSAPKLSESRVAASVLLRTVNCWLVVL